MTGTSSRKYRERVVKRQAALFVLLLAWSPVQFGHDMERHLQHEQALNHNKVDRIGGTLMVALRSEPKTLNPVISIDATSREVISTMQSDLIHINRQSQDTQPGLAEAWIISKDGLRCALRLRRGVRFSDGAPFDADDVLFTFQVYLDANLHSPQRDLLLIDGKPITVKKVDSYNVVIEFAKPYAPAERLFDGLAVLPRHLLEKPYKEGKLGQCWGLASTTDQVAGLGPFRLKEYVAGQKLVVERNPYYWKSDGQARKLPYLESIEFLFVPNDDAQVLRFLSSETQLLERIGAANFTALLKQPSRNNCLEDLGSGLEYIFLFFNLNTIDAERNPALSHKQSWFRDENFRKSVSAAVDRESIARIAYSGRAAPIWGHVTPGNRRWIDPHIPRPPKSEQYARELLASSGFKWKSDGSLLDPTGKPVEFTILASSSNAERVKAATIVQEDLHRLGMNVHIVPLDFHSLVDRVLNSKDYDSAIMNLVSGDADPASEMNVWLSTGETHLWNLGQKTPQTPWEAEIDELMQQQLTTTNYVDRKHLYDRVQHLVADHVPMVFLVSPHILVGAARTVGNFRPGILYPYALWNADELFLRSESAEQCP
jgi:peptide/nickel transport system substrate-binding protein